jgi:SAM-dependent methyltransferase
MRQLERNIRLLGPWEHQIELAGVRTLEISRRPHEPLSDHPRLSWKAIEPLLPGDLNGLSVLDIGCRDGWFSLELARRGADVLGTDSEAEPLARADFARRTLGLSGVNFLKWHPIEPLPRDRVFDFALMMELFPRIQEPWLALKNIAAKAPTLILRLPVDFRQEAGMLWGPSHKRYRDVEHPTWIFTSGGLSAVFSRVGYDRIEIFPEGGSAEGCRMAIVRAGRGTESSGSREAAAASHGL